MKDIQQNSAEWVSEFLNAGTNELGIDCSILVGTVATIITRAQSQTAKAYGGCIRCYGKGYATQIENWSGHGEADFGQENVRVFEKAPYYLLCSCDRGKQFAEALARTEADTIKRAIKLLPPRDETPDENESERIDRMAWNAYRAAALATLKSLLPRTEK